MCVLFKVRLLLLCRDSTTFVEMCHKLASSDDIVVGAVVQLLLGHKLSENWKMQSHIDKQSKMIKPEHLKDMV